MAPIDITGLLSGGDAVDGDALGVRRIEAVEAMLAVRVINASAIGNVSGETRSKPRLGDVRSLAPIAQACHINLGLENTKQDTS
jgi:hypothetical protein